MNRLFRTRRRPPQTATIPLDRKEFYSLAAECRTYATELANFDQHRVNLKECHRFNAWLSRVRQYDRLAPHLKTMSTARPVARWQVIVIMVGIWGIMALALPGMVSRQWLTVLMGSWLLTIVAVFFIPESFYGTTTEMLEARVLRVVDTLTAILDSGTMEFSEAAYYQVRRNLTEAHEELRLQIDLAHRPPTGPIL